MRPHGRASVSVPPTSPFAICDRCGFLYNHNNLRWQHDWRGTTLANLRLLVCDVCLDQPADQLRVIVIPPDPMPVMNARLPQYAIDETDYRTISGQDTVDPVTGLTIPGKTKRTTQGGDYRVPQQTGAPSGSLNAEPGTDPAAPGNDDPGLPYGNTTVPNTGE